MAPSLHFLSRAALTYLLLFLPDLALYAADYRTTGFSRSTSIVTILALASWLAVMKRSALKTALIVAICIQQAIWCGAIVYFGDALTPDRLQLLTVEVSDAFLGVVSAVKLLAPILLLVLGTLFGLLYLHRTDIANNISSKQFILIFTAIVIAGLPIRWVRNLPAIRWAHGEWYVFPPSLTNATATAFPQAVAAAIDTAASKAAWPDMAVPQLKYGPPQSANEPTLVVVIMGESINPFQLSLFDRNIETTPHLLSLAQAPPDGFELISRIGFSAGVATLASVPQFIRPSHDPLQISAKNLFEIARENNFDSWYLSTQSGVFLTVAGGAPSARRVVTSELISPSHTGMKDAYLVDLQRQALAASSRLSFIFLHQRANHAPYTNFCKDAAEAAGSDTSHRILAYQSGIRCWDSNVHGLLTQLKDWPGAAYGFVTADHNEFMGEDGLWGHTHPVLENALVPMLLFTNRPQSAVAQSFRSRPMLSAFFFTQEVSRVLGTELTAPGFPDDVMLLNGALPFGVGTSFSAKRIEPWKFEVKEFVAGKEINRKIVDIPEAQAADNQRFLKAPLSQEKHVND